VQDSLERNRHIGRTNADEAAAVYACVRERCRCGAVLGVVVREKRGDGGVEKIVG
jgi:hypothetical protein